MYATHRRSQLMISDLHQIEIPPLHVNGEYADILIIISSQYIMLCFHVRSSKQKRVTITLIHTCELLLAIIHFDAMFSLWCF